MNRFSVLLSTFVFITSLSFAQKNAFKLFETANYASCVDLELRDSLNRPVKVPADVTEGLKCPVIADLRDGLLCYMNNNIISLYDISSDMTYPLLEVYPDLDGYNGPCWSASGHKVAFVMINQERKYDYTESCRIVVLSLDENYAVRDKRKFDRMLNFTCGAMCYCDCGTDIRFDGDNILRFRRNENIEERPGEWETIILEP